MTEEKQAICQKILKSIGNKHTHICIKEDIKGNYYSCLNDTIYLNTESKETDEELIVLCHESYHSIQSKALHLLNFVFSNIEIILFVGILLLRLFQTQGEILKIIYYVSLSAAIICRTILEMGAITKSFVLAEKFSNKNTISDLRKKAKKYIWLQFICIYWLKIVRLMIILII